MVIYDYISLRVLLNYTREKSFYLYSNVKYNGEDIDMSRGCVIFEGIVVNDVLGGNYRATDEILLDLENKFPLIEDSEHCFNQLLLFMMYPRGNFHKDEDGKVFHLDGEQQINFDLKRSHIENLTILANHGMKLIFRPTSQDFLKLCRMFFRNLYSSNIIH